MGSVGWIRVEEGTKSGAIYSQLNIIPKSKQGPAQVGEGDSHIKRTAVLFENFENNPEALKSYFLGVG